MRSPTVIASLILAGFLLAAAPPPARAADPAGSRAAAPPRGWKALFNGKDLAGWETWLSRPNKSVQGLDLPRDDKGEYCRPVGVNVDPKAVYTVVTVDGAPAIRISGEIFGALTSLAEYGDFHLRLSFKWGDKRWPPRETEARDSGLLYHSTGPHGRGGMGTWMESLEFQIQEHDTGDFWSVGGRATAEVQVDRTDKIYEQRTLTQYRAGGSLVTAPSNGIAVRVFKSADHEKPTGEWNTLELLCVGGTCVHVVNGKANMVLTNTRLVIDGKDYPLRQGRLQLQSEGAEIFYRDIFIKPLKSLPKEFQP